MFAAACPNCALSWKWAVTLVLVQAALLSAAFCGVIRPTAYFSSKSGLSAARSLPGYTHIFLSSASPHLPSLCLPSPLKLMCALQWSQPEFALSDALTWQQQDWDHLCMGIAHDGIDTALAALDTGADADGGEEGRRGESVDIAVLGAPHCWWNERHCFLCCEDHPNKTFRVSFFFVVC